MKNFYRKSEIPEHLQDYFCPAELGLEPTPEQYVENMVDVFREVRRVLRADGTLWLNLGDSYAAARSYQVTDTKWRDVGNTKGATVPPGLKPKDLVGIPWRVAFALQADGWWLRSDIIWCLSGGTKVYARTQKGEMPTTIKDLVRLDPSTVQLWNGEKWTQVLGWNESDRGEPLEIELRSGEKIGCTPGHVWPTQRGNVRADEIEVGDVIQQTTLPEPEEAYSPMFIGRNVAWMLGLYLAEGSRDNRGRLQFAGHSEQSASRAARLAKIAEAFGGTANAYDGPGNAATVVVDCPALSAIVDQYIHGRTAKTKGIKVRAWRHSNVWLESLMDGYLEGDGHHDLPNRRWRLGFTRNDRLAGDLRTIAARLGATVTIKATTATAGDETWPAYRGEWRWTRSGHHSERSRSEVVAIGRSRARKFWDIGVADDPHLFALASGVLTHNSKPNPMPESVTDRPTKSHEYLFLLTKSARYYYDADAIREPLVKLGRASTKPRKIGPERGRPDSHLAGSVPWEDDGSGRNKRDVWTITTKPFHGAHFAVFPPDLPTLCIKAGTSEQGCCSDCGAPMGRVVDRTPMEIDRSDRTHPLGRTRSSGTMIAPPTSETTGWQPTCECGAGKSVCVVLDPFAGSGTVGVVCSKLGRDFIGIELNPEYADMARKRIHDAPLSLFAPTGTDDG